MNYSYWKPDVAQPECEQCLKPFDMFVRRHHCRDCGGVFCHQCTLTTAPLPHRGFSRNRVRICQRCSDYVQVLLPTLGYNKETFQRTAESLAAEKAAAASHPNAAATSAANVASFLQSMRGVQHSEKRDYDRDVHDAHQLLHVIRRNEDKFMSQNDLIVRAGKSEGEGMTSDDNNDERNSNSDQDDGNNNIRTMPSHFARPEVLKAIRASLKEATPTLLHNKGVPKESKLSNVSMAGRPNNLETSAEFFTSALMPLPAPSTFDAQTILFDMTVPYPINPQFAALKQQLAEAHSAALSSVAPELPRLTSVVLTY